MNVIVFEDSFWQRLLPLVYLRASFQLVCGAGSLLDRVQRLAAAPHHVQLWCRPALADVVAEECKLPVNQGAAPGSMLLLGRGIWRRLPDARSGEPAWVGTVGTGETACVFYDASLGERLSPEVFLDEARRRAALAGVPQRDVSGCVDLLSWPWELVHANEQAIRDDWNTHLASSAEIAGRVCDGAYLLGKDAIHVGRGAKILPCAVIDAEDGPVWVGENVTILPHVYVRGPAVIGDGCLVQPGSVVHEGTTLGPVCKIGGEIEASIIQGYSNKQHDGFLGHSYVGSWVNIAADCINSDLKNTYGTIRAPINGRGVETGEMFCGMFMGDYSKAGINVSFPTGSMIGFCSSIFSPRSPKFVPSFAWIDGDRIERYDEKRGLAIARKVMLRRKRMMSAPLERAFLAVRQQALAIEHQPQRFLQTARAV
jgi:UDP-N-acetylglucosamine diphosphorylase/glucosamine-1-phosphate N-acetyltransferase